MEDFVSREEFNTLKNEVKELKEEINEYKGLLQQIDKKIDVITERMSNGAKMDELKLQPLISRISKLEENQTWIARTIGATIIAFVIKVILEVSKTVS